MPFVSNKNKHLFIIKTVIFRKTKDLFFFKLTMFVKFLLICAELL